MSKFLLSIYALCIISCLFAFSSSIPGKIGIAEGVVQKDTIPAPEENRFTKVILSDKLDEPMELIVLNNGQVIFIELKGKVKLYDPKTGKTKVIAKLAVYDQAEDGLLGIAADPDYDKNNFIYIYYSPLGKESINRLSRFVFKNSQLDLASEKVVINVPVWRSCCHSGGSVAFGPDGNLYLSTGDDTPATKFSPSDERPAPGEPRDAQRSTANTNDLRGKVLRIHPSPNGGYTIPEGNLFPKGTPGTRPEIFTMGVRNPFRISIDQKTGFLYWGDVGPDAGEDSAGVGPKGYDELNQARKPGNFGWPYFIGNNQPYNYLDFATGKSRGVFDPANPLNLSPNNTGLKQLPPLANPFIWYPYGESKEFPLLGVGGRMAMAGPVFYSDSYAPSVSKFPEYYNGKLFFYEWMRDLIMTVTMDKEGNFVRMERFLPGTSFSKPMDMQFGKDGALYVLEYGAYWHSQNNDSRLARIEFAKDNRKPIVKISSDKLAGGLPLTVAFSSEGTFDYDKGDSLSYRWTFDKPGVLQSKQANPAFTFTRAGVYTVKLSVKDKVGKEVVSTLVVRAGNEPPQLGINVTGNRSFYWDSSSIQYQITISDREDGSLAKGTIKPAQVKATFKYVPPPLEDDAAPVVGHQEEVIDYAAKGRSLIKTSDCMACHAEARVSVGPSFLDIAKRYRGKPFITDKLTTKVIKGGGGVWGDREMAAHPQLAKKNVDMMIAYILSVGTPKKTEPTVPLTGQVKFIQHIGKSDLGTYQLAVNYKDRGTLKAAPLTGTDTLKLRFAKLTALDADLFNGAAKANSAKSFAVKYVENKGYVLFKKIDLTDIGSIICSFNPVNTSGKIEIHLDSPDGRLLGSTDVFDKNSKGKKVSSFYQAPLSGMQPIQGVHDIYAVLKSDGSVSIWNAAVMNALYFQKAN